jgi:hypothetical protein
MSLRRYLYLFAAAVMQSNLLKDKKRSENIKISEYQNICHSLLPYLYAKGCRKKESPPDLAKVPHDAVQNNANHNICESLFNTIFHKIFSSCFPQVHINRGASFSHLNPSSLHLATVTTYVLLSCYSLQFAVLYSGIHNIPLQTYKQLGLEEVIHLVNYC